MIIKIIIGVAVAVGLLFTWSMLKAAGDADRKLEEITEKEFKNK